LAQGEAGLATFDAGIEQPPTLAASEAETSPRATASGSNESASEPPTKNQQRELAKSLELLAKRGAAGLRDRKSGWVRLSVLAKEINEIPPALAAQVASHAVAIPDPTEQAIALPALVQAARWKHLRLAMADALAASRLPAESQRQLVEALTGESVAEVLSPDACRQKLLASVLKEVSDDGDLAARDTLERTAQLLASSYRQRAALLGVSPADSAVAKTPAELLEALVRKIAERAMPAERLAAELRAARYLTVNDPRYTVALQRMFIELLAQQVASRLPQQAAAARRIATERIAAATLATDALTQLYEHEAALLELWMLYAPEI
jgi:hypothetical protein